MTTHIKQPRRSPVDTSTFRLTSDSGWKTLKRARKVETEYQGIKYHLQKRIELPHLDNDDDLIKFEWFRNGESIPSRNVPHPVVIFLTRAIDKG